MSYILHSITFGQLIDNTIIRNFTITLLFNEPDTIHGKTTSQPLNSICQIDLFDTRYGCCVRINHLSIVLYVAVHNYLNHFLSQCRWILPAIWHWYQ